MKRITPESIPEIFKQLGIEPIRYFFTRTTTCQACLIGLLASLATSFHQASKTFQSAETLGRLAGFSDQYSLGLSDGWESPFQDNHPFTETAEYLAGFEDGQQAYQACLEARMTIHMTGSNHAHRTT